MRRLAMLLAIGGLIGIAEPAAAGYIEVPVSGGGGIVGRVRVTGDVQTLPPQPVFKQKEYCGLEVPDERLVVEKQGGLRNVIVYLANVSAGKAIPRERLVKLENHKCAFVPHVLSASLGQTLEIHNSDPFLHDAHALLGERTLFNLAIPKDRTVRQKLSDAGLVYINCNVRHTWMHAYLYVGEHPYHAVTGEGGEFAIDEIPPGKYKLAVWHELLGSADRDVTVESGKTATVEVELKATAPEAP